MAADGNRRPPKMEHVHVMDEKGLQEREWRTEDETSLENFSP